MDVRRCVHQHLHHGTFQNPRGNERIIAGFETLLKLKRGCIQLELKIGFKGPEKQKKRLVLMETNFMSLNVDFNLPLPCADVGIFVITTACTEMGQIW